VTVTGLASREPARVLHKGRVVRRGTATAGGKFVARFKVTRSLGRTKVWGQGQFTDIRRGATYIRVVR
jgi:hypothetical protein